ncbi:MAG: hypothetical protein ABJB74_12555 [Gemmatimonas sp.]
MNSDMTSLISAPTSRKVAKLLAVATAFAVLPVVAQAQVPAASGKWVANISQLKSVGGSAELRVEPRSEKESRAKLMITNSRKETRFWWDIVAGRCNDEGTRIAPQAKFTMLQGGMDGSAEISANIPKLESGKLYYVRVFEGGSPGTDASAYGCGNLAEK